MGAKGLPDYLRDEGRDPCIHEDAGAGADSTRIRVNAVAPGSCGTPLNPSDGGLTADEVAQFA